MSERGTSAGIEDVLSSIRRLVSEDLRPAARVQPPPLADTGAGKLILTPALRVVVPDPRSDLGQVVAGLGAAVDARPGEWEPETGEAAPRAAAAAPVWQDDDSLPEAPWFTDDDITNLDVDEAAESIAFVARPRSHLASEPPPLNAQAQDWLPEDATLPPGVAELAQHRLGMEDGTDAAFEGGQNGDMDDDLDGGFQGDGVMIAEPAPAGAAFPAPEFVDAEFVAPEFLSPEPLAATGAPGAMAADDLPADDLPTDAPHPASLPGWAQEGEDDAPPSTDWSQATLEPDRDWADAAEAEALAELSDTVAQAVPGALSDDFLNDTDPDALRELVRELIVEELQGPLGERITRNIRKLVRAEIARALAAEQLY